MDAKRAVKLMRELGRVSRECEALANKNFNWWDSDLLNGISIYGTGKFKGHNEELDEAFTVAFDIICKEVFARVTSERQVH